MRFPCQIRDPARTGIRSNYDQLPVGVGGTRGGSGNNCRVGKASAAPLVVETVISTFGS